MNEKYTVDLSPEERAQCQSILRKGKHSAEKLLRVRILLKTDVNGPNLRDQDIVEALDCGICTVRENPEAVCGIRIRSHTQ